MVGGGGCDTCWSTGRTLQGISVQQIISRYSEQVMLKVCLEGLQILID